MKFSFVGFSGLVMGFALSVNALAQAPAAPAVAAPAATPVPAQAPTVAPAADKKAAAPVVAAASNAMEGKVAHYGARFHGRTTACGSKFNANAMTMAHKSLPCGTMVKVTNLKNKKAVIVKVTDRGPATPGRIADVSTGAGRKLGMIQAGVIDAKLEIRKAGVKGKKAMKKAKKT
jgi:rare lipoprotein A